MLNFAVAFIEGSFLKSKRESSFLLTCEHAKPDVPSFVRRCHVFESKLFNSHRSFDLHAFDLAKELKRDLSGSLHFFGLSRLVIDANRTLKKKKMPSIIFSELDREEQSWVIGQYKLYRKQIDGSLARMGKSSRVTVVLSVHTFTPYFKGRLRSTDIGLLFRTDVEKEKYFAERVRKHLAEDYQAHLNRPYRGYTDCLLNDVSDRHLSKANIVGLFLEVKDSLLRTRRDRIQMAKLLSQAIQQATQDYLNWMLE